MTFKTLDAVPNVPGLARSAYDAVIHRHATPAMLDHAVGLLPLAAQLPLTRHPTFKAAKLLSRWEYER